MGTKIDNGVIRLLASSSNSVKSSVDECLKTQPLNKDSGRFRADGDFEKYFRHSMDRMTDELRNVSSIKKAMLQHDHVFKQQVKELHRLYSVQKMLMTSFKESNRTYNNGQNLSTNHRCFEFDLEQAAYEDEQEADTELTLSIGEMKNINKNVTKHSKQQPEQTADVKLQEERSNTNNSTTSDRQAMINKRPHWLLQSLSSHKT